MPTEEMARAILDAVDAQLDEQIALTRALVACKSFSAREGDAQTLMRDELTRRGYEVDSWTFRAADLAGLPGYSPAVLDYDQTFNVVGTLPAAGTGRSLILNGHVDVVPVGDERRWSQDPFEPRIADGRLYGRGSGDMKAGVVANLFAVEAVRRAGLRPAGRIHLQSVVDEESSGNGTLACVARGYTADAAIIPEPTSNALVTAQIGILWFDLTVEGDPQHASGFQGRGANAIEKAYDLVRALKRLEEACNRPERRHPLYADHPHPIRLNIGRITGGDWHSSVPASCHVGGRLGVYPDQDPEEVMAQIRSCIEAASRDDAYLREHPPVLSFTGNQFAGYEPRGAEAIGAVLADAHRRVTGAAIERVALPYGSDARVLGLCAGIPSLLYGPHCERAHGIDECVDLESVRTLTRTLALVVARWCGVVPAAAP